MKITFLGTSSFPTMERNSQSTLIEFDHDKAIIIDCGEGTQRQLMSLGDVAKKIEAVYLTHHHIDHVSGLPGLIMYLFNITKKKIKIIAPWKTLKVSRLLIETLVEFIDNPVEYIEVNELYNGTIGPVNVNCFSTYHTDDSIGYSFIEKDMKVTLCGDLEFYNKEQRSKIVESIKDSKKVIIDVVHLNDKDALDLLGLLRNIKKILLPVPFGRNKLLEEALKIKDIQIPNDYDFLD